MKERGGANRARASNLGPTADAAFTQVYDQDIRRLLAMSDMWLYRVPPVPLDRKAILTGSSVDSRASGVAKAQTTGAALDTNSRPGSGLKDQKVLTLRETFDVLLHVCLPAENIISFDKDDNDTLDFVTAAANLRAYAYGIEQKTRWEVKEMAGNIIPAIATTNAIIVGLIVLQAINVLKSLLPSASNPHTGGALANSSPKNVLIQTKTSAPLGVQNLCAPNPHCVVCPPVYVNVACDPVRVTLGEVVRGVLGLKAGADEHEPRSVCTKVADY